MEDMLFKLRGVFLVELVTEDHFLFRVFRMERALMSRAMLHRNVAWTTSHQSSCKKTRKLSLATCDTDC